MAERKSSVILELKNRIGGPLRQMRRQVSRATRDVRKHFGNLGRRLRRVGLGVSAAAAGIGVAATRMVFGVAAAGDKLAKFADQIGLGVRELQQFHFVAERMGVDTSRLDQSLGAFSKRLGEARNGTGALTTYLKKANPGLLEQLKNTEDLGDAFNLYLKALEATPNKADQAAGASAAFSREGLPLIRLVRDGIDNIGDLKNLFDSLHGGISKEDARNAEAFQDAWANLKTTIAGVKFTVAGRQIGVVTGLMKELTKWVNKNHDRIAAWSKDFADKLPRRIETTLASIRETIQAIKNLVEMVGGWKNAFIGLATIMAAPIIFPVAGILLGLGKIITTLARTKAARKAMGVAFSANPLGTGPKAASWSKWLGKASAVAAAGAVGWAIGSAINKRIEKSKIGETVSNVIGRSVDNVRALFGSEDAQNRLDNTPQGQAAASRNRADRVSGELERRQAEERAKQARGEPSAYDHIPGGRRTPQAPAAARTDVGGTLKIEIDSMGRPRVKDVRNNGPMDFDIDSGPLILGN